MAAVGTWIKKLSGGSGKGLPWGFLCSSWGDAVICLPDEAPRVVHAVFAPGEPGKSSWIVGFNAYDGRETRFELKPLQDQHGMTVLKSVLLATCGNDGRLDLMTAMVGGEDSRPTPISRTPGAKLYRVNVERTMDDGAQTGIWRGFVSIGKTIRNLPLALEPALRLPAEASFRVAGNLEFGGKHASYLQDVWLPENDRLELFGSELIAWYACTKTGKQEDPAAYAATRRVAKACAEANKARIGRQPVFTLVPFGHQPLPEQTRALGWFNEAGGMGKSGKAPHSGKASALNSIVWTAMLDNSGGVTIEVHGVEPGRSAKPTLTVSKTSVLSADKVPCRMALSTKLDDGTVKIVLLPDGPDHVMEAIRKAEKVSIVYSKKLTLSAIVGVIRDWTDDEAFSLRKVFTALPSGKVSNLNAAEWGGSVYPSGITVEIHHRKAAKPTKATLHIRKTTVESMDGRQCQIVLSLEFAGGKKERILLPEGTDTFNESIRQAKTVSVVHNIETAENLGDLVAFEATVSAIDE